MKPSSSKKPTITFALCSAKCQAIILDGDTLKNPKDLDNTI
jgi:hypothetical protein